MSDKPIIIDGVDVAGCKNFISVYTEDEDVEINNCCTLTYTPCQFEKKDCYFKQLQRLKAENEELKIKLMQQLEAELQCLEAKNAKYKQALEEIREIALKCPLCDDCSGTDDCERYCGKETADNLCSTRQMNNFVLKINEVLK